MTQNLSMKTLFDLMFQEELQQVFDHISTAFGFRASILDTSFQEITPLRSRPMCNYCQIIQQDLNLRPKCVENDTIQCIKARETRKNHHYICHGGLAEAIFPLFIQDECFGYLLLGQFRIDSVAPQGVMQQAHGQTLERLVDAHQQLPAYNEQKLQSVLELLKITVQYLIEHRIVSVKRDQLVERIVEYIESRQYSELRVQDAADFVHRSVSTVNTALKIVTGKSFKQLSMAIKMEEAAKLLLQNSDATVAEISESLGIEDPFYFSRMFQKIHGVSPRSFVKNQVSP